MKIWSITRTLLFLVQFIQVASWCNNTDNFLLNGWKKYNGALYKQFGDPEKDYTNWEMFCQSYGGSLATAKTAEENAYVFSILTFGRGVIYIGLKNNGVNWMWNDGTPVMYSNWSTDAVFNQRYNCAYLYVDTLWSPISCSTSLAGGMCKCPIAVPCNATNPCSNPYAECTNGICQCRSGYTLSGTLCTAAVGSPCDTTNGCSNPYASCIGGYCQCRPGYSKRGAHCKADVGTPCDTYYGCSNPGASCNGTCQCKSGYDTSGSICKAVVGAVCDQIDGCSNPYAHCTNGICDCMSGYTTNGTLCQGALGSTCDVSNGCSSPYADCNSGTCQCRSGYTQNGTDCEAVLTTPEYYGTPVAWIVGGIIAGLVVILLVGIGFFLWRRSQHKKQTGHEKEKSMGHEESTKMNQTNSRQDAANVQEYEGQRLTGAEASQDPERN